MSIPNLFIVFLKHFQSTDNYQVLADIISYKYLLDLIFYREPPLKLKIEAIFSYNIQYIHTDIKIKHKPFYRSTQNPKLMSNKNTLLMCQTCGKLFAVKHLRVYC